MLLKIKYNGIGSQKADRKTPWPSSTLAHQLWRRQSIIHATVDFCVLLCEIQKDLMYNWWDVVFISTSDRHIPAQKRQHARTGRERTESEINLQQSECDFKDAVRAHFVSSWSDSSCFRCLESSFFSMERRTQALALPTSVLISLMFWMCLRVKGGEFKGCLKEVKVRNNPPLFLWKRRIFKKWIKNIFWKIRKWYWFWSFFVFLWLGWRLGKPEQPEETLHRLKEIMQKGLFTPRPENIISSRPASYQATALCCRQSQRLSSLAAHFMATEESALYGKHFDDGFCQYPLKKGPIIRKIS